ncbi:uncharacterized protein LACBIDRAFT_303850 [Laccaria bicolor S238N-H82]|uniref:Predicted protein n=1 Tax=Laccaria bicolor (strain S238N-H82 / ATCC MYA-4686) TaxID=486041 RepID=B0DKH5_LACBS|nr:uncharacterized protein LACBIDRAFT_303850 [Laccaria bicolor S238N-H82]EDR05066.1 predicted protein [Laccaria bicolor S238N-H82]|eukprot:XP_001884456.1 predicted protein [Laccaria bicolor S238N-H82]
MRETCEAASQVNWFPFLNITVQTFGLPYTQSSQNCTPIRSFQRMIFTVLP